MRQEDFEKMAVECAASVLKASGSNLSFYSMDKTVKAIKNAPIPYLQEAFRNGMKAGWDTAKPHERGWQTIESAPKDGEIIVSGKSVLDFNEKYVCTAWRDVYGTFHTEQGALKNQPSIWMPIPEPPKD